MTGHTEPVKLVQVQVNAADGTMAQGSLQGLELGVEHCADFVPLQDGCNALGLGGLTDGHVAPRGRSQSGSCQFSRHAPSSPLASRGAGIHLQAGLSWHMRVHPSQQASMLAGRGEGSGHRCALLAMLFRSQHTTEDGTPHQLLRHIKAEHNGEALQY